MLIKVQTKDVFEDKTGGVSNIWHIASQKLKRYNIKSSNGNLANANTVAAKIKITTDPLEKAAGIAADSLLASTVGPPRCHLV
jgi:hypothetical protein